MTEKPLFLDVLNALTGGPGDIRVIAKRMGKPWYTLPNKVQAVETMGLIKRDEEGAYNLTDNGREQLEKYKGKTKWDFNGE